MYKVWTVAWRELYVRFTDRNLLVILIATPLAISTIVGLAFGGLGGGDVPIQDIPVAIVNHDTGTTSGLNFGQVYVSLLVPGTPGATGQAGGLPGCDLDPQNSVDQADSDEISLTDLTDAVIFDEETFSQLVAEGRLSEPANALSLDEQARLAVDQGVYSAAILIPEHFSQSIASLADPGVAAADITVYANSGRPISAGIIRSIVEGITNQILTGNIAVAATFAQIAASAGPQAAGQAAAQLDIPREFACAFTPETNTVRVQTETITAGEQRNTAGIILVSVGSSQAMFFALFTAQFGVLSMYEERRQWTLQRLITSPTPRSAILAGKLIGVFVSVLFQLLVLFIALTVVGSILQGGFTLIWGDDVLGIAAVLLSASLAVSGLGMLLAGVVKSPEQGQVFASVLNIAMAVLGGAFGFTLPRQIAALSILYWGRDAFDQLAAGQTGFGLNVAVLLILGVLMYGIGLVLFNRRFEM